MSHYGAETGLDERASRRARNGSPARDLGLARLRVIRSVTLICDPFPARTKTSLFNTTFDDPSLEGICNHSSDNSPKMLVSISGSSRASPAEADASRWRNSPPVMPLVGGD